MDSLPNEAGNTPATHQLLDWLKERESNARRLAEIHLLLRAALATQPQEVQKPVGWLHDRVGSSFNPHFKLDGKEADELRNGLPPLLTKDSNSVNWRPVYLGPQPEQVAQDSARLDWLMWHADPAEIGISIPDYQDKADYLRKYRAAIDARTRGEGA